MHPNSGPVMDRLVRTQLRKWPQRPPGMTASLKQPGIWLKGRPGEPNISTHPFLKVPGSNRLRTLPDGLWLHFSPSAEDPYVDILCIEACSSLPNLLDKRSRFAPSVSSLVAVCPVDWLLAPAQPNDLTPRWRLIRMLAGEPSTPLILPVRDARVLFGLARRHFDHFAESQIAQPHELFCPMEALVADRGHESPAMRELIFRSSVMSNFMDPG
ncbi:MAG: hypothetical protein K2X49_14380 [Acetobacteraceae bacterium]|nr:hypothetical protein [Acetobacteraceae bacterium]